MKKIAIMNVKGGVGKTITAVNLSEVLASEYHKRVLLIDADAQADASYLLEKEQEPVNGLYGLLTIGGAIEDFISETKYRNLDIIPADSDLFYLDMESSRAVTKTLKETLEEIDRDYDYCIIDCPPSFSAPSVAAVCSCDSVLIPVKLDAFGEKGARFLADEIEAMNAYNSAVSVGGIVVTMWHNSELCRQGLDRLYQTIGVPICMTKIRRTDKADESTYYRQALSEYSRYSSAGRDYRLLAEELFEGGIF